MTTNLFQRIFSPTDIDIAKRDAKKAVQAYYNKLDSFSDGDGGAHIAAVIRPDIALAAQKANAAMEHLRCVDPAAAKMKWTPYPAGRHS